MADARIRVSQLSFFLAGRSARSGDISFALGVSRTGLVAPNDAGKSTLLKLLAGQLQPCPRVGRTLKFVPPEKPWFVSAATDEHRLGPQSRTKFVLALKYQTLAVDRLEVLRPSAASKFVH